jgi:hypothetical protein
MWDFSVGTALSLMARTAPFIIFRIIVYFGITTAIILMTGAGAGLGYGIGAFGEEEFQLSSTFWGGAAGFGLTVGVIFFFRDYLLYLVKAGHIAVMVELLHGGQVPGGRGQLDYAWDVVRDRFGEASALFALDRLVHGVITAITGIIEGLMTILPIPGVENLMGVLRAYLRVAVGLIDEMIIAQAIRTRAENPWKNAQDGLVLYAQNARPMLVNAAWLTAMSWVLAFVVFLLMLGPAAAVVYLMPGNASAGGFIFAFVFAWAVKAALIEPFCIACLMQVYFKVTEGQQPDPEWAAKLNHISDKFRHMGDQAASWIGSRFQGIGARTSGAGG